MKYSININSSLSLKVCVGEFNTFEDAKVQMAKLIMNLIDNLKDSSFNAWENFKEDFPDEIQTILKSYEETGVAYSDVEICGESDSASYKADESDFEASGKRDMLGYSLSLSTNAINIYDPEKNYSFKVSESYDGGRNQLDIQLIVDDGAVAVYNMIPDDIRARLEVLDEE
jgi:hypothetical protein